MSLLFFCFALPSSPPGFSLLALLESSPMTLETASRSGCGPGPTSERAEPESVRTASPLTPPSRGSAGAGVLLRRERSDPLKGWELLCQFRHVLATRDGNTQRLRSAEPFLTWQWRLTSSRSSWVWKEPYWLLDWDRPLLPLAGGDGSL